jgi:hypothetical protein
MTENPRAKTDGVVPGQHGFARKCHATERARSGSARSFGRPSLSAMGSPDQGEGVIAARTVGAPGSELAPVASSEMVAVAGSRAPGRRTVTLIRRTDRPKRPRAG